MFGNSDSWHLFNLAGRLECNLIQGCIDLTLCLAFRWYDGQGNVVDLFAAEV
jgi:hypothetical protein